MTASPPEGNTDLFLGDISIDQNCVSNGVGRILEMIFFSKKKTHYGYEK